MVAVSPWHFILVVLAGWVHREQREGIESRKAENRALREQLGNQRHRCVRLRRRDRGAGERWETFVVTMH